MLRIMFCKRGPAIPRASSEPDKKDQAAKRNQRHRMLRLEISKLKRSNKLKELELEAKDVIIQRLVNANNYLTRLLSLRAK
jgi:hypothetical protein